MSFSEPVRNIEQFGLEIGQHVADLGVGSGFYALEAAKRVGGEGRVYAVDIQKDLLERVKTGARRDNITNLEIVWGDLEKIGGSKLRDASVDAAIVTNILFQLEDKETFVTEVYRILKSKGKVLLVDWSESFGNMGPPQEQIIPQQKAEALFLEHGFSKIMDITAGAHHYGSILQHE